MNIFNVIAHASKILPDAMRVIADVKALHDDPKVAAALAGVPEVQAAVTKISQDIRSLENDVAALK